MNFASVKGVLALIRFMIVCIAVAVTGPAQAQSEQTVPTQAPELNQERPARLLVIVSDPSDKRVEALESYLLRSYPVQLTTVGVDEYRPIVDERIHDGFIYWGQNYYAEPSRGLLADMAQTEKPILWMNYHLWRLDAARLEDFGLTVSDDHSNTFTQVNFFGLRPLGFTDTTRIATRYPARVLFWLFNDDMTQSIPGAAKTGNLTYLSYLPLLDEGRPDHEAFDNAARTALENIKAVVPPPLSAQERLAAARADKFRDGLHLPYIFEGQEDRIMAYDSEKMHPRLLRIREAGADWVTISQTYFQNGIRSSHPVAHEVGTASFEEIENVAQDAHDLGLFVRLSVIVNLSEGTAKPGEWRGMINAADPDAWWNDYRKIVVDAARFAKQEGIESLSIGAELNGMQTDDARWRTLVEDVRQRAGYEGLVGYQVNYNSFDELVWADALDYLSVAAYWPLATQADPSLEMLIEAWEPIGEKIYDYLTDNPLVSLEFGEIGYTSQPFSAVHPYSWKPSKSRKLNLNEQLTAYLALEDYLIRTPDIEGVGLFASTAHDLYAADIGYSPFSKPAEDVMRRILNLR